MNSSLTTFQILDVRERRCLYLNRWAMRLMRESHPLETTGVGDNVKRHLFQWSKQSPPSGDSLDNFIIFISHASSLLQLFGTIKNMQKRDFQKIKKHTIQTLSITFLQEMDTKDHLCFLFIFFVSTWSLMFYRSTKVCLYRKRSVLQNVKKNRRPKKNLMDNHHLAESWRKGEPLIFTLWDAEKGPYVNVFFSSYDGNLWRFLRWLVHFWIYKKTSGKLRIKQNFSLESLNI